jgi:hypothetical protein
MIMDTDTVEARLLAAHDERGEVGQRSPNRDSDVDADPRHLMKAPSFASKVVILHLAFCPNSDKENPPADRA